MNRSRNLNTKSVRGFSLVELVIVIAIAGVLATVSTLGFNSWMVKNRVEAQVRQMVSDISQLRIRAMTTKQRHSVAFNASSYVFRSYTSEAEPLADGTVIADGTKNVTYRLKNPSNAFYDGSVRYEIDTRGILTGATTSVFVDYDGSAGIDCFSLHTIRVNAGKKNTSGDTCNDR